MIGLGVSRLNGGGRAYRARAVNFDGTNDYLTRGAGLTGAADSKLMTGNFWVKMTGGDGVLQYFFVSFDTLGGGTSARTLRIFRSAANAVGVTHENSAGTIILNVLSATDSLKVSHGWMNVLFSFDMSNTGKRWLYLNDVSSLSSASTYTDDTLDFTNSDWSFGAQADGTGKLSAEVADVILWPGAYIDLSVEANRRLFLNKNARPVDLARAIKVLGAPAIYFRGSESIFPTNRGAGGNFSVTGGLTAASSSPSV